MELFGTHAKPGRTHRPVKPTAKVQDSTSGGLDICSHECEHVMFFHGATAAVLSHGLVKERVVPSSEIDAAIERRRKFVADPAKHTHREQ